ncbi:glyoxalase [Cellulomonas sp. WB94]|uniref:VOC family protein n=1 Tax=Cellulomonas sp. WB94 TaxID=2173174 RepID=UPI000D5868BB|nr:VOC family protein [Cellulomonas sp. WB94]PVU83040.1 glyoxalase [Cellulomonas sp. WB94]
MEPRLTLLTLGVRDVARSRRFYVDALGWPAVLVADDIVMVQVEPGLVLSLWDLEAMRAEVGTVGDPATASITLAHNVSDPAAVTRVLDEAVAAGGTLVQPGQVREWGGFSGYFADPDGYRWEVAHNPGLVVAPDGTVTLGPVG